MNLREWLSGTPLTKPWLTPVVRRLTTDEIIADSQDIQELNIGTDWLIEQVGNHLEIKNKSSDLQYWSFRSGGFINQHGASGGSTGIEYRSSNGTISAPTATTSGNLITTIFSNGHNGSAYARAGSLLFTATENWTAGANGSKFDVQINETGTKDPDTFLSVQGTGIIIGKTATNYTLPIARGTDNQLLISDASGLLTFQTRQFGELFWVNNVVPTVVAFNVWTVSPNISTSNITPVDFTHNGLGRLTYTGTQTRLFRLTHTGTFLGTTAIDVQACVGFMKNGVFLAGAKNCWETINNSENYTSSIQKITSLSTGDFVEIGVLNETNTDSLVVRNCNFQIMSII